MSEEQKRAVSNMMDNELPVSQMKHTIQVLKSDESLRKTWQNYHLISAVLQNSLASEWLSAEIKASLSEKTTEIIIEKNQPLDNQSATKAK